MFFTNLEEAKKLSQEATERLRKAERGTNPGEIVAAKAYLAVITSGLDKLEAKAVKQAEQPKKVSKPKKEKEPEKLPPPPELPETDSVPEEIEPEVSKTEKTEDTAVTRKKKSKKKGGGGSGGGKKKVRKDGNTVLF